MNQVLYYLLPLVIELSVIFFEAPPYKIAFIDVLLTLLFPTTFGSFTVSKVYGLRAVMTFLFIEVIFFETGGRFIWAGPFVLLFRMFLLSFSLFASIFAFYYLTFSANRSATALAIFLICWFRLLRHPRKLKFLTPFLILLLFL